MEDFIKWLSLLILKIETVILLIPVLGSILGIVLYIIPVIGLLGSVILKALLYYMVIIDFCHAEIILLVLSVILLIVQLIMRTVKGKETEEEYKIIYKKRWAICMASLFAYIVAVCFFVSSLPV